MAEKIHAGKRRSRSDAISYLCTKKCQCLPNYYYSGLLIKEIKSTTKYSSRFHKSTCKGNSTTLPTNNNNNLASSQVEEIIANEAAKAATSTTSTSSGSAHGLMELQVQGVQHVPKLVSFVPKNKEIAPLDDEHSQTVGPIKANGKEDYNIYYYDEDLSESSSLYSLHASNNTNHISLEGTLISYINYEEPGDVVVKEKLARTGTGIKRRRNAEVHNLHEKKRRDEINKKMLMLKDLIPNCNKMDKASMLDDAIEYLKALKCQLQIISMGVGMPLMVLPPHMMMMYTPHLHDYLMGFRSPFPNQMPPMPISHPPPMVGDPSIMAENQASFQLTPHPKNSSQGTCMHC